MGALTGSGAPWSVAAAQELAPHEKRHSVLCRRNGLLTKGFEEEKRLSDPALATALQRERWTCLLVFGAAAASALLVLAAVLLKRGA